MFAPSSAWILGNSDTDFQCSQSISTFVEGKLATIQFTTSRAQKAPLLLKTLT
jgi:hypothetical protein